jgi:SIR2-like domain
MPLTWDETEPILDIRIMPTLGCPSMTFASFKSTDVQDGLKLLATADQLAVFVGAGVSAEAGLPRWPELVKHLLFAASEKLPHFADDKERRSWVARTMLTELPPGAAGIAETLLKDDLVPTLAHELYRRPDDGVLAKSSDFEPGPTGHAVAALRRACDSRNRHPMKILTTNYDRLLEKALLARDDVEKEEVCSIVWPFDNNDLPKERVKVHHLHGYFNGTKRVGDITLTDASYYASRPSAHLRDKEVLDILAKTRCLFLGTSFTDPNIMRYIFTSAEERRLAHPRTRGPQQPQHVAPFSHHSVDPNEIRTARQQIAETRLSGTFTKAVFVEHYADVSQFVYDLRNQIAQEGYVRQDLRAAKVIKPILSRIIHPDEPVAFDKAQPNLSKKLQAILKAIVAKVDKTSKSQLSSEPLALAIWLLDEAGERLTPWITTDRAHRDPHLLFKANVVPDSRWLAVRTVCEGKLLQDLPEDSRWTFIASTPLLIDDESPGRACIGALTIATLASLEKSSLYSLNDTHLRALSMRLNDDVGRWLTSAEKP